VLPILLLVLFAAFDFMRGIYAYNTIADAARTGARVAIVDQECDLIRNKAIAQALALNIQAADVAVSFAGVDCTGDKAAIGDPAMVSVTYAYTPATPIISNIVGTLTLVASSEIPVEYPCSSSDPTVCPAAQ
jgi:Flp pilus assembly protein TadG